MTEKELKKSIKDVMAETDLILSRLKDDNDLDDDMDYCDFEVDPFVYDCSMSPDEFISVRNKILSKKVKVRKVGTSVSYAKKFINSIRHCSDFYSCFCSISNNEINIKIKLNRNMSIC